MHFLSFFGFLFALTAFSKPLHHDKRYDLDCNGTPDWCYVEGALAHCLGADGSWTAFPASSSITCPTTGTSSISQQCAASSTTATSEVTTTTTSTKTATTTTRPSSSTKTTTTTTTTTSTTTTTKSTVTTTTHLSSSTKATTTMTGPFSSTKTTTNTITGSSSSTKATTTTTNRPSSSTKTTATTNNQSSSSPSATTTTLTSVFPTGLLPSPSQFKADKGQKWTIELQGNLSFTGAMASNHLGGDKGRTSQIGDKIFWNFGDMECAGDWTVCGFSMGAAFYGTDSVMTVDTDNVQNVQNNNFVLPWSGDPQPASPYSAWGMDTSNVAAINSTHGVAFAWEIWRNAPNGSINQRGNAVASVTLGADMPVAERVGPLLTGPDSIALGLLAILRDGNYIYTYSMGGPSNIIIGRVPADDSVFDASKHEFLEHNTDNTWVSGVPLQTDDTFGATTINPGGQFGCGVYGSVFYNTYIQKYIILCDIYMSWVNMYTSDTPYGPWSAEYGITSSENDGMLPASYGSMAHPEYGNGKEWYFSVGPNGMFQVFKITFDY